MRLEWNERPVLEAVETDSRNRLSMVAGMIKRSAQVLCPVQTGALRDSIRVDNPRYEPKRKGKYFVAKLVKAGNKEAYYASFVELGHKIGKSAAQYLGMRWARRVARSDVGSKGRIAPRPYMRPALKQSAKILRREFGVGTRVSLRKD